MNLKGKDFLKLLDFSPEEIEYLINLAADLKAKKKAGETHELCKGKNAIGIINKTDLDENYLKGKIEENFAQTVFISAKTGKGKEELTRAIEQTLGTADFDTSATAIVNDRQCECCKKALDALIDAENALEFGMTMDAVTVCLDSAIENLMILTGEKATELVVNEIFAQFCVGK